MWRSLRKIPAATRRKGMTLVELLVVIAIIGMLSSLLLPAITSVRETAIDTDCRNKLRNLGTTVLTQIQLNRIFPFATHGAPDPREKDPPLKNPRWAEPAWYDLLKKEMAAPDLVCDLQSPQNLAIADGGLIVTAADYDGYGEPKNLKGKDAGFPFSYTPNSHYFVRNDQWEPGPDKDGIKPPTIEDVRRADATIMFSEGDDSFYSWGQGWRTIRFRHRDACNIVFMDGHLESWNIRDCIAPQPNPKCLSERPEGVIPPYAKLPDAKYRYP
jgi:prepilin-type N-terminal cleavage/methylation domain-containing protein/prepilin-type processing-associated H-X9-DG protein